MTTSAKLIMSYALRNLLRHKRRTVLTTGTVALSCFISLVGLQYAKAGMKIWKDGLIEFGTSHIQVMTKAMYNSNKSMRREFLIPMASSAISAIKQSPQIAAYSERLRFEGTLSTGKKSVFFLGMGIDPIAEARVSPKLFEPGLYNGSPLSANNNKGIVIGKLMAKTLEVKPGDFATILTRSLDGQINSYDVTISGILDTPLVELSRRMIYMNINPVREFLIAQGSSSVAIRLDEQTDIKVFSSKIKKLAHKDQLLALTWYELNPSVLRFETVLQSLVGFICVLLFLSAGNSVLNIIFLSVEERTVEIGTLMAVGISRIKIATLLVMEAICIGVFGVFLGLGLGVSVLIVLHNVGVGFANPFAAGEVVLYPEPWTWNIVIIALASLFVCAVAVLLPAYRATKVEPISAMRGILR